MALLTHKKQPVLGTVLPARVAAARATLAGVVGVHADAATACQGRLVGQQSAQLRKGPTSSMPIGLARFGGHGNHLLALAAFLAAFGPLANAGEVFQADQAVGIGVQDLLGDGVVGAQLKPSLSLAMAIRRRVALRVPLRWSRFWVLT